MRRRVSWSDCDSSGRIRFQAAFDWFVDAGVGHLRERGVTSVFETMPAAARDALARPA
jgi:acyl-CoA thioesterase FadM